jgi:hypothetical protein
LEKRKYEIESAIKKLEEHGENRRYEIESSIKKLEEQGEKVQKETDFWRNRVFKVIKLVNGFNNVSDSRSLNSIKDELSSLFSDEELEIAGYVVEYQEERNKSSWKPYQMPYPLLRTSVSRITKNLIMALPRISADTKKWICLSMSFHRH